jgi:hypothetical protein
MSGVCVVVGASHADAQLASALRRHGWSGRIVLINLVVVPYNTSNNEMLRRPLETTLGPAVAVMHKPVGVAACVQRLFERIEPPGRPAAALCHPGSSYELGGGPAPRPASPWPASAALPCSARPECPRD